MKTKFIIILLTACLLTGCGKNENIVTDITDVDNKANYTTEATDEPTNQPDYEGLKIYTEEDFEDEDYYDDEDEEYDEEISQRDLSDIIVPIEGKVYNEVKSSKKTAEKNGSNENYKDVPLANNVGNKELEKIVVTYDTLNKGPEVVKVLDLKKNLKQKFCEGKCVKVENNPISLYQMEQICEGDVNDIDVIFNCIYDDTIDHKEELFKYNIYYYDKVTKKEQKFVIETRGHYELQSCENCMTPHTIKGSRIAITELLQSMSKVCFIDVSDKTSHVVDIANLIETSYGIRRNNPAHPNYWTQIEKMTFVGDDKLAVMLYSGYIFVYDIKNECITSYVETDSIAELEETGGRYRVSLDDGICNLTYKNDDGTYDYYAIDLDTMQIVSHVENPDRYFIDFMGLYKDGVTYFTNSYGIYAYNPETKGYDCIYDQMENDTEYTWEKIKDDKYRDVFVKPLFKGNDIYLCRGIRQADDCIDWEEAICKKLTIK